MSRPLLLAGLAIVFAGSCGGPEQMSGFAERDARAVAKRDELAEPCRVRTGRLVLEVERAIVREYPHTELARLKKAKQPMILLWIRGQRQPGRPPEVDLTLLAAPEDYLAGDRIRFFEGRRVLDRPLRALEGRMLELRLAENDRTLAPEWARYAHQLVGGAAGAAGAAGLPVPPGGLVDELVNQLARLDRDDLILIWRADVAELAPALSAAPPRLLRLSLATTRRASAGSDKDAPAAELDLLLYREPEPGCP